MKPAVTMVSGFATAITGAFIRSCNQGAPAEFAKAWCGDAPLQMLSPSHAHCAGCAMAVAGLGVAVLSAIVAFGRGGGLLPKRTTR